MATYTVVSGLTAYPIGLGDHASAVFSDGESLVLYYDGTNLVYRLSSDQGATWGGSNTITAVATNSNQVQMDATQSGDTVYGAVAHYTGKTGSKANYTLLPFKLAYSSGSVTVSVGTGVALTSGGFAPSGSNPDAGGSTLAVAWDSDHSLLHVGVKVSGALVLYAFNTSLANSFNAATTGISVSGFNCPIAYAGGNLWALTDNGTNSQVASCSVSGTAYGSFSALSTMLAGSTLGHGAQGGTDTTQASPQPLFTWADGTGKLQVATYSGSAWTVHNVAITGNPTCYGAAISCVGSDLWVATNSGGSQNYLIKRVSGTWQASAVIATGGDRTGSLAASLSGGTVVLLYITANSPYTVSVYTESGGTAPQNGAAALSGSGASALAGSLVANAGAAETGAGASALTPQVILAPTTLVATAGASATLGAVLVQVASASPSGSGAVGLDGRRLTSAGAAFTGSGASLLGAQAILNALLSPSGDGAASLTPQAILNAALASSGSGASLLSGLIGGSVQMAASGSGLAALDALRIISGSAGLSGSGSSTLNVSGFSPAAMAASGGAAALLDPVALRLAGAGLTGSGQAAIDALKLALAGAQAAGAANAQLDASALLTALFSPSGAANAALLAVIFVPGLEPPTALASLVASLLATAGLLAEPLSAVAALTSPSANALLQPSPSANAAQAAAESATVLLE